MARRRTRRTAKIVLSRYKIAGVLLGLGVLYFFLYYMAPISPVFKGLAYATHQGFGERGSFVFFGLLSFFGLLILIKPQYYTKWLFKFGFLILLFVSAVLDFELLDIGFGKVGEQTLHIIKSGGGWLGYLVLWGMDSALGGEIMAIKVLVGLALLSIFVALILYYKIKIPSIAIEVVKDRYIRTTTAVKNAKKTQKMRKEARMEVLGKSATVIGIKNSIFSGKNSSEQTLKSLIKDKLKKKVKRKNDENALKQIHITFPKDKPTFNSTILTIDPETKASVSEDWLFEKAQAIKNKLAEFNIDIDIEGFNVGPTVIQIKIVPPAGIKISKIENLKKDLSLGLRTKSLRILAPIPGTNSVGIEIPNPKPQMVRLREVIEGLEFSKSINNNFTNLSIGKGIDGNHIIKPLERMPHLLVAGATGSGKSVGVNDFIVSLIYQNTPSELKFIMVDPKQVELGMYEGIPYLLSPIITKADKAVKILKRAVNHMEDRYTLLKNKKVRNLDEYNRKVGEKDKMYRLVIIIDELADLMMSGNKKDTENYITRIAQKARAVGIHLILATQRPSVNVITGIIKANIPTRIAFGVVSQIDSRTIIDSKGAEDLVGRGDLLYSDPSSKYPIRIQAPFISTEETEAVVQAINDKYMSNLTESDIYHPEIMRILENKGEYAGPGSVSDADEDLINQAMDIISRTGKASATMLQRKLGVGFPRAARLIDALEERGVVGPQEGAKAREVLI